MDRLQSLLISEDYTRLFAEAQKMAHLLSGYQKSLLQSLESEYRQGAKNGFNVRVGKLLFELSKLPQASKASEKWRVLMLCANPAGTTALKLREEHSQIIEQLQDSDIELLASFDTDKTDLMREPLEAQPHILHFSGMGQARV